LSRLLDPEQIEIAILVNIYTHPNQIKFLATPL